MKHTFISCSKCTVSRKIPFPLEEEEITGMGGRDISEGMSPGLILRPSRL